MAYSFGLVLSGGGTRGAFHIGIVKALQEVRIKPDLIAGCSVGSLIGAFFAADIDADEIFSFLRKTSLFSHPSWMIRNPGMFDSGKYVKDLLPYFPENNFQSLNSHLRIYATDLLKGELVELESGDLCKSITASCAIPGIFTPVEWQDKLLSDGGIIKVFPVSPIREITDKILGVLLISHPGTKDHHQIKHTHHVLDRALTLSMYSRAQLEGSLCDWLIDPPEIGNFNMISKKHIHDMYDLGYSYGLKQLKTLTL